MRRLPHFLSFFALTAFVGLSLAPLPEAHAQSAAELEAARGLFSQGAELEKKKDYAGAYDKFRKVAEIKSTAVVRYHEGFCAEKAGKWVEALDAWSRAQIDGQGDPKQKDAVEASRKAADSLRPRVPRIKVRIEGAKGKPQVSIDGAVVSAVLLDDGLPVNVGPHVVEISGGGAANDKQDLVVVEKETKEVVFNAKEGTSTAVVVVPPAGSDDGKPKPKDPGTGTTATTAPPAPTTSSTSTDASATTSDIARFGLVFGLSLGSMTPGGQIYGPANESTQTFAIAGDDGKRNTDASQWMGTGGALELDVGFRFVPALAAYGFWQHGFLGAGTHSKEATNYKVSTNAFGLGLMLNTNPRKGFGFYADFAVAYRATVTSQDVGGSDNSSIKATLSGVEPFRLKIGAAYKPSARFTIVAFLWASAGSYTKVDYNGLTISKVFDIDQTATHTFAGLGIGGFYDLPLGKQ